MSPSPARRSTTGWARNSGSTSCSTASATPGSCTRPTRSSGCARSSRCTTGSASASRLLSPDDTLRRLPILRGGEPVAGAVLNDDAIVHHDAVVWAHLEHLARSDAVRILPGTTVTAIVRGDSGIEAVETSRGRIDTPAVLNATDGWSTELNALAGVSAPNRPVRREVLVTAPLQRSIEAADHLLPTDRGLVQPDAPGRDRDGRRRSRRAGRRGPTVVVGFPPPNGRS